MKQNKIKRAKKIYLRKNKGKKRIKNRKEKLKLYK